MFRPGMLVQVRQEQRTNSTFFYRPFRIRAIIGGTVFDQDGCKWSMLRLERVRTVAMTLKELKET